jgi:opacity protein-like surface antigen
MKRIICVLIVVAAISVNAQQLSIGPRAGMNFSSMKNLDASSSTSGFTGGATLNYRFLDFLGVGVDALYSAEGAKYVVDFDLGKIKYKTRLSYLRVPVLLNAYLSKTDAPIKAKIMLGPAIGFLLDAKSELEISGFSTEFDMNKSDFKSTDFGAIAGAGIDFVLKDKMTLNLDGRYYFGATKIFDNDIPLLNDVKNNCASVTIGLSFIIGE